MRRSPEAIQNVLDFIELPIEEKEMAILPQSVRKPLPFESALLFLAPTVYEVIKTFVNDWLAKVISELENDLKSNYFKLIIILFLMLGLLIISLIFILAIVRRFSKETKRKQVKQILPKLLKDVLEEKQSQHYHSRQFPKRWLK